ncbi:MAG: hypothetical protein AAF806_12700 [Bacteroidota bacterium]
MSVTILKDEFLKLEKSEQINFGKFVLEKLFSTIDTESILNEQQQKEIERRYNDLKSGVSKGTSLADFKVQMKEKYGI